MTDTPSRGEITRQNIIQVAHDLFIKQGYHGTSMRQIANAANLALSGLYNHFPGKEDVFREVFLQFHPYQEVIPALSEAQGDSIEEILRDAMNRMITALQNRPQFLNLMFIEIIEMNSTHANELFLRIFPMFTQIAEDIYQKHHNRLRTISIPIFVRSFMGMLFSYFITELIFSPRAPVSFTQNALDQMLDIYMHGVLQNPTD